MFRHITLALFSLVFIAGSWLVAWYLYDAETDQISYQFEREIGKRVDALEQELVKHRATLRHWKSFFEAGDKIEPDAFRRISRDVLSIYPSLQMVSWAPRVEHQDKEEFERQTREKWSQFKIYDVNSDLVKAVVSGDRAQLEAAMERVRSGSFYQVAEGRKQYFPFTLIEPMDTKGYLLGVDLTSVSSKSFAMQVMISEQSNDVVAMPVFPSPFSQEHEPIFSAIVPIMREGNSARALPVLEGYVVATIEIESMVLLSSLKDVRDINFSLIDETGDEGMTNLYQLGTVDMEHENLQRRMVLPVFGRQWTVVASPKKGFTEARRSGLPWIVASVGTFLSLFILLYMGLLLRQNVVVRQLVDKRTRELREANKSLSDMNEKLAEMSRTDGLTKIANRRFFNETLESEWRKGIRSGKPLGVILMDVDHFKRYNDHYGHLMGDDCLIKVAEALKNTFTRAGDLVARYGGEEFVVILPNTGADVTQVAERARAAIEAAAIPHEKSDVTACVTVSIGACSVVPSEAVRPGQLVDCADQGLYLAKENGRNRVIYHTFHDKEESLELDL